MRAGRGEVANETRSLFRIGVVRDAWRVAGSVLAAVALGSEAREGFVHEQTVYLVTPDGEIEPFEGDAEVEGAAEPGDEQPTVARADGQPEEAAAARSEEE